MSEAEWNELETKLREVVHKSNQEIDELFIQILKERSLKFAAVVRDQLGVPYEMPELTGAASRVP